MKLIQIIVLLMICCCCSENNSVKKEDIIRLTDKDFLDKGLELSQIIKINGIINLETNNQSIIGKVDKVIYSNSHFYILDKRSAKSVFIFDEDGKYINKIQGGGKGPEEILSPSDITFDEESKELLVLDQRQKKVCFYTNQGVFKRYIHLSFAPTHIELLPSKALLFVTLGENSICITDKNGMTTSKHLKAHPRFQMNLSKPLFSDDNHVYFTRFLDKNIYKIENTKVSKWKTIDYGENGWSQDNYEKNDPIRMNISIPASAKYGIYSPVISNKYICFFFNYKRTGYFVLKNGLTGNLVVSPGIPDDLFGGGVLLITGSWRFNDKLITIIEPSRINPIKAKYLESHNINIDINSNPSLLIFDFNL